MLDVCVIGSANLDVVARSPRIPQPGETLLGTDLNFYPGGKGLNQAVSAARSGAATAFVGALGIDDAGRTLQSVLDDDGIDSSLVDTADLPTGRAIITVDDDGENTIIVIPGANSAVRADSQPDARVLLAQLEIDLDVVAAAFAEARQRGIMTVLNPAPAVPLTTGLLSTVDYLIPNEHELDLSGGAAHALDAGCRAVITTLGAEGVDIVTIDGTEHVPAFAVDPIDTVGAGDAFCGAFAARIAAGDELGDAVRWAAAAGALATTVVGAVAGQPTAAAIQELLAGTTAQ